MKKIDIVEFVRDNTELTKSQAEDAVHNVFRAISESLISGESVFIRGFATFKVRTSKRTTARHINNNTLIEIEPQKNVKLILCKNVKSLMNDE
jgi:DNA-binding protein HU-beta